MEQVTFEGNLCQNNIADDAFKGVVMTADVPVKLTLPILWDYKYLPKSGESWHGGNFNSNRWQNLDALKERALYDINVEIDKITDWSEEEKNVIKKYIGNIQSENNESWIGHHESEAFLYLAQHENRKAALSEIKTAMGFFAGNEILQSLIVSEINTINTTLNKSEITTSKNSAIEKLSATVAAFQSIFDEGKAAGKAELPTNGTTGNGVRITLGTKSLELMNPEKVEFFKK